MSLKEFLVEQIRDQIADSLASSIYLEVWHESVDGKKGPVDIPFERLEAMSREYGDPDEPETIRNAYREAIDHLERIGMVSAEWLPKENCPNSDGVVRISITKNR